MRSRIPGYRALALFHARAARAAKINSFHETKDGMDTMFWNTLMMGHLVQALHWREAARNAAYREFATPVSFTMHPGEVSPVALPKSSMWNLVTHMGDDIHDGDYVPPHLQDAHWKILKYIKSGTASLPKSFGKRG